MSAETGGNGELSAHGIVAKLSWALRSATGPTRETNEDYANAYVPTVPDDAWDRGPLFVVADGMGGHAAGEIASRLAVEATMTVWTREAPQAPLPGLRSAVRAANVAVYDAALAPGHHGMGTTLTVLTLSGQEAVIAHVGDSRAYVVHGTECEQLTSDHSRVGEMLRMKLITPSQAAHHPARSQLTRTVGGEASVQVDIVRHDIRKNDTLILCSDGLWDLVSRAELAGIAGRLATRELPTPADAVDELIECAYARNAADNVTAIVVQLTSDLPIPTAGSRRSLFRRRRG
jgi:serine/threonine protein phosphatase PrpC